MSSDPAARLRAAGLRTTPTRVAVLGALESLGGHRTADEIGASLGSAGPGIPRASLYHVLGALAEAGVVLVADAGPGTARYEVAAAWHHHLVCRVCGAIVDVPCVRGTRPCLEADLPGVAIDEAQVIFRGRCASCAGAQGSGASASGTSASASGASGSGSGASGSGRSRRRDHRTA